MTNHANEFQAISKTLYHWSAYDPSVKCDLCCTALKLTCGLVVIDPVPLAEPAWAELLDGTALRAILLTNGNHVRGAEHLRKKHKVPVVIAPATRRDLTEIKPDVVLLETEL